MLLNCHVPKTNKLKQVAMLDLNNDVIKVFINSKKAAEHVGLKQGDTILKSCRNNEYSAAGYKWKFYNNDVENYPLSSLIEQIGGISIL